MLTKIDLCSFALLKLGEEPIQSLTDNSASAQLSRTLFDPVVEALIASHPWRFAQKKFELTKTADDEFLIPSEVLRVLKCPGEVIGNTIISSSDVISISAIVRTLVEYFPSYFVSLAATKLAMEFCIPLLGDQNVFRMLAALYESELRAAKFIDSTISVNTDIGDFSLVSARF
ncbi:MAG TPA: hypothetical protein PLZ05_00415 [Alphaproteobacteria bacterium]|nr:hypothetical protein [Alphaproteobacteria bacterium]